MSTPKTYSLNEVAAHDSESDCWVILKGKVLDLTGFEADHPGKKAFVKYAGQDITEVMLKIHKGEGHSESAYKWAEKFEIGVLEGYVKPSNEQ